MPNKRCLYQKEIVGHENIQVDIAGTRTIRHWEQPNDLIEGPVQLLPEIRQFQWKAEQQQAF